MSILSRKFFYSASAFVLTLQVCSPFHAVGGQGGSKPQEETTRETSGVAPRLNPNTQTNENDSNTAPSPSSTGVTADSPESEEAKEAAVALLTGEYHNFVAFFRQLKASGNQAPDAEIVKHLFESQGNFMKWDKLTAPTQALLTERIKTGAEQTGAN